MEAFALVLSLHIKINLLTISKKKSVDITDYCNYHHKPSGVDI
jgi:hypothetical protein